MERKTYQIHTCTFSIICTSYIFTCTLSMYPREIKVYNVITNRNLIENPSSSNLFKRVKNIQIIIETISFDQTTKLSFNDLRFYSPPPQNFPFQHTNYFSTKISNFTGNTSNIS